MEMRDFLVFFSTPHLISLIFMTSHGLFLRHFVQLTSSLELSLKFKAVIPQSASLITEHLPSYFEI